MIDRSQLTQKLFPIEDILFQALRQRWFQNRHRETAAEDFLSAAQEWFLSSRLNHIIGLDAFPDHDVMMGCTHFIESLLIKYGLAGIQILPHEYNYYNLMGMSATLPGQLRPGVPLIVSIPNFYSAAVRADWYSILEECEAKQIPVHVDMAWLVTAKNINIDLDHPCIHSVGMSLSKYGLHWNRIGVRWSRRRTMDSITMYNHWQPGVNANLVSCGAFMIENIPRDHIWDTYHDLHHQVCGDLGLLPTDIAHVARDPGSGQVWGIGHILGRLAPDTVKTVSH